jgi:hypothetical protein
VPLMSLPMTSSVVSVADFGNLYVRICVRFSDITFLPNFVLILPAVSDLNRADRQENHHTNRSQFYTHRTMNT